MILDRIVKKENFMKFFLKDEQIHTFKIYQKFHR